MISNNQQDLGAALVQRGKLDEAIAEYRKAIDLAPTSNRAAGAYFSIGNVLYRQKKMTEAIAAYHRVIELDPSDKLAPAGHFGLGNILRDWGKLDEAAAAFRKVIEFNRPDATLAAFVCLGEVLFQQNKLDEAIGVYRKIIELKADSPRTHSKLAWILATRPEANLRDPKQAVVLARRAIELAPNSEHAWQSLGWIHYRTGNWKSSIEALEKSCKLQKGGTGDAGQWIVLALAHAKFASQAGLPEEEQAHHKAEARRRYEQADKQIDRWWRVRPGDEIGQATWDFRAEARELLSVKEIKK